MNRVDLRRVTVQSGFSMVELLIATLLMVVVTGAVFGLVNQTTGASSMQPEEADTQQRLRLGVSALQRDVIMAGAGGEVRAGGEALSDVAPVMPYRFGVTNSDVPGTFRTDIVTVIQRAATPDAELLIHAYYLSATDRLMHYDGLVTDLPVLDNVVKLEFLYWGDPIPPQLSPRWLPVNGRPSVSYGPRPPGIGTEPTTAWPAGENCTFTVADGAHVPRLAFLNGGVPGSVELTAGLFTDGPWCPDATSVTRYDADLLRIRRIRVTLRVQASEPWFRGPASMLFLRAGTAKPSRSIPDQEIAFDVSPRNMNLGR